MPPFDETDAKIAAMLTDGGLIKAGSSKTILVKGTDCETRYLRISCIDHRFLQSKIGTKPVCIVHYSGSGSLTCCQKAADLEMLNQNTPKQNQNVRELHCPGHQVKLCAYYFQVCSSLP